MVALARVTRAVSTSRRRRNSSLSLVIVARSLCTLSSSDSTAESCAKTSLCLESLLDSLARSASRSCLAWVFTSFTSSCATLSCFCVVVSLFSRAVICSCASPNCMCASANWASFSFCSALRALNASFDSFFWIESNSVAASSFFWVRSSETVLDWSCCSMVWYFASAASSFSCNSLLVCWRDSICAVCIFSSSSRCVPPLVQASRCRLVKLFMPGVLSS
mmetsp:Transcript_35023/g.88129  ORF Transcript_35023/g.88129 Transcript_35023/m.88129 type:complete len:220 (-) Transcript_35023:334-993(-)